MSSKLSRKSLGRVPAVGRPTKSSLPALTSPAERLFDGLYVVYQPIVDIARRRVFAYEALVRNPSFPSPMVLFETALGAGRCGELGREIRQLAINGASGWPLFLNVHPQEFGEPWIVRPDDALFAHDADVFLEITESVPLTHFQLVTPILRELRGRSVRLVVDDLGAGYSNLRYISDLEPEVVKLDRGLIAGLHNDRRQRTLVGGIVRLCADLGAKVVAEGIEEVDELACVMDCGVQLVQGYLIAKPATDLPGISDAAQMIMMMRSEPPPPATKVSKAAPVELARLRKSSPTVQTRRPSRSSLRPPKTER